MNEIIISIKPVFANKIYSGEKTVELRKRVGKEFYPGRRMYIYSSSPEKEIKGYAVIDRLEKAPVPLIKEKAISSACISSESLDAYYHEKIEGVMIWLRQAHLFKSSIPLSELRKLEFTPPQSYCYASDAVINLLRRESS